MTKPASRSGDSIDRYRLNPSVRAGDVTALPGEGQYQGDTEYHDQPPPCLSRLAARHNAGDSRQDHQHADRSEQNHGAMMDGRGYEGKISRPCDVPPIQTPMRPR